jgi:DNA-binding IclR family transcriptional regulator
VTADAAGNSARVVAVLDAVVRAGRHDVGVRELAAELAMSRSAVHRILVALGDAGYARPLPNGRYRMTGVLTAWGARLEHRHRILVAARPVMASLAEYTRENVYLYLRLPASDNGAYVATTPGSQPVSYSVELGQATPLHVGAAGRACLAALPEPEASELLARLSDDARADLEPALTKIRADEYAVTVGQILPEASGVAAAVRRAGTSIGSLTVSMPAYRLEDGLAAGYADAVIAAGRDLSTHLDS